MNVTRVFAVALVVVAAWIMVPCDTPAQAAFIAYLKIDTIDGGSTQAQFPKWSEILGYNIGVTNTPSSTGGGGAGKPTLSDVAVRKNVDVASPQFFGGVLTGRHYANAKIDVRKPGATLQKVALWEFQDASFTSYNTTESPTDLVESLALNYAKVTYSYFPQQADGSSGSPVVFSYDRRTNTSAITGNPADLQFVTSFGSLVPEPSSLLLLGCGLGSLVLSRRRGSND